MARITVTHRYREAFDVQVRGYRFVSDEPVTGGGEDEGPTPTELMVAGLAACAAEEGMKYLADHGLPQEVFEVHADFVWDSKLSRVDVIRITVELPAGLDEEQRASLEAAMLECPARKMLVDPPAIAYSFGEVVSPRLS